MRRRTFLIGGLSGVAAIAATGCIDRTPRPGPSVPPTSSTFLAPAPADMVRSSWSADPYARGSFSFLGVGTNPIQRSVLAEPIGNRVFFAGEATSVDRPGTVLGARDTGTRAASEVISAATRGERVAVIGAGIAGATAARRLVDAGFAVTVLEARERVGGRIDSRRVSGFDVPVELGADRLDTASADDLLGQLRAAGVITLGFGQSTLVRASDGTPLEPSTMGRDTVTAAIAAIGTGDESVAAAVYASGLPGSGASSTTGAADLVRSYLRNDVGIAFGADARDISARYGLREGSRDTDRIVLGGYERLIARLLDGVTVWTTNVVSEIAYGASGVNLRIATGESLRVDRVVVTVPLGVLKSRDIRFAPELPIGHRIAAIGLEMGTTDKIWLRFDAKFWTTDAERWTTVGGDLDITEWLNLAPKTGSPILVGLVGGERAVALADLADDEVVERARRSLEPFLGA